MAMALIADATDASALESKCSPSSRSSVIRGATASVPHDARFDPWSSLGNGYIITVMLTFLLRIRLALLPEDQVSTVHSVPRLHVICQAPNPTRVASQTRVIGLHGCGAAESKSSHFRGAYSFCFFCCLSCIKRDLRLHSAVRGRVETSLVLSLAVNKIWRLGPATLPARMATHSTAAFPPLRNPTRRTNRDRQMLQPGNGAVIIQPVQRAG